MVDQLGINIARKVVSKLKNTSDKLSRKKVGQVVTAMETETIRIALDPGNGAGKIWMGRERDGQVFETSMVVPSYIAPTDELYPFSVSADGGVTFGYRYDESPTGDETGFCRLVGQRVARSHAGGLSTIHAYGRKTHEAISFVVGAILALPDETRTSFDVDVCVSVISPAMADHIRSQLNGIHHITVSRDMDEVQLELRVNVVKVLPEGAALPALVPEIRNSTLIDIGHGTCIVGIYEGGAVPTTRTPYNLGTSVLIDLATKREGVNIAANQNGDAALRRYLIEESLLVGSEKKGYCYAGIDITTDILEASEDYSKALSPVWKEAARIHRTLGLSPILVGGGSCIPSVANAMRALRIGGKVHKAKRCGRDVGGRFLNVAAMYEVAGW